MASTRARRCLLWALLLGAACLARALPGPAGSPTAQTEVAECDPSEEKCEDLARCSPPTARIVVPEAAVLVLGNTGCGKSTLTTHLSGDDGDMQAVVEQNQFLITGEKIGSSVTSVTQIPELMTDKKTGTNYFDCPGFEDSRGSCVEVTTTFYMKDILRHARRVKVLLLAPHFAVRRGHDRRDFVTMLLHTARVLRGVDKLRGSVALVVTKVDAVVRRRKEFVQLGDDVVKEGVATFLREDVLPSLLLKAKESLPEEADELQRAVKLLKIFTAQDERGNYTHIGLFRTPDEEGRLSDIALMEQGRQLLLDMVHNEIRYAEVQPSDFGFSVSDRTKLFALQQSRNLSDAVVQQLADLGHALAAVRAEVSYDRDDIAATAQHFFKDADEVRAVAVDVGNSSSVQTFCDRLAADVPRAALADAAALALAARVAAECRHLDVLQTVSDAPLVKAAALASQWSRPLHQAADGLAARGDWNRYLATLYDRLNIYDMQAKRAEGKLAFPPSASASLAAFGQRAAALGLHAPPSPVAAAANLDDLNALLSRASAPPQYECLPDGLLVVRGESLLLSEVAERVGACGEGMGRIQVYALNTVFVDRALRLPGVSLAVVSPRWEVVGDATIDLSGAAGPGPSRAPREAVDGQRGADGEAGRPGRPGGHFLGVGLDWTGRLRVSASGGRGGNGQNGGPGGLGKPGGGHGADGGHGGVGGPGGKAGRAVIKFLGQQPDAVLRSEDGLVGEGGRGGSGGDHRAFAGRYRRKRFVGILLGGIAIAGAIGGAVYVANKKDERPPPPPPPPVFHDGARGQYGLSHAGLRDPDDPRAERWTDVPSRTAAYLELNLRHPYRGQQLKLFKKELDNRRDYIFG